MTSAIETVDLTRRFGRLEAVEALNLQVPIGSVFALVGPNGAGKTTTIKLLMNLVHPTRGRAFVMGADSQRLGPRAFERIGYVSENQRLPNWLTLGGAVLGLTLALAVGGTEALGRGATGWLLGGAILAPFFVMGAMGAGDVKLLAMIGAFVGPEHVLNAFICAGLIGGVFALALLVHRRQLVPALVCLWLTRRLPRLDDPGAITLPYGVAIAAGGVIVLFLRLGGGP